MGLRRIWNRTFWAGVVAGVALVLLARLAINESTIPDRLLAPMLLDDSSAQADAIVVLGAGVIGDCVPNLNGMRRVLLGAKLFRDGRAPLLVITGGSRGRALPGGRRDGAARAGFRRSAGQDACWSASRSARTRMASARRRCCENGT